MTNKLFLISIIFALLTNAQCAPSKTEISGLNDSILNEIKDLRLLPKGDYKLVRIFETEDKVLSSSTGAIVNDKLASNGKAREVVTDIHGMGHLAYGPYIELQPGNYVAFFRIKLIDEIGTDEDIALLDSASSNGVDQLQKFNLTSENLILNKYVQVPLSFAYTGGRLETRLLWNGIASMRLDNISIYKLESGSPLPIVQNTPRIPQVQPTGFPNDLPYLKSFRSYKDIFPVSTTPSPVLDYMSIYALAPDMQLLMQTFQGIVNRDKPVLYLKTCPQDGFWMDWMKSRGFVKNTVMYTDPAKLIAKYRKQISGVVITDPALSSTKNIATMIAGVENLIVASPRLAKKFGLPIVRDLRGKWTNDADAYRWAFDNLWDKMNHNLAACLWPHANGVRDYLVQHKVFIFWIPGPIDGAKKTSAPEEQMKFVEEFLAKLPVNIPIMGYPYAGIDVGIGEGGGVGLMAEFGKYLVGSISTANMSVHSGYKVPAFNNKPAPPASELKNNKTYITFVMSDGDNIPVMTTSNWPQIWKDKTRGEFPIAWSISPASCLLIPDIMDYYYQTATKNDIFMAAVSGVGYTYPTMYGKRYQSSGRQKVFDEFLEQSRMYMKMMDLESINPSNVNNKEIRRYAEIIPEITSIFPDYGRIVTNYNDATGLTARGVPVFHAVTGWDPKGTGDVQIDNLIAQIKDMEPERKPAFMHVFLCNWFWSMPMIKKVIDKLGPDYIVVSPNDLAKLCKEDMESRAVISKVMPMIVGIKDEPISFKLSVQNVKSHDMTMRVSVDSGLDQKLIEPEKFKLASGESHDIRISGIPVSNETNISIHGEFGVINHSAEIRLIDMKKLVGDSVKTPFLSFVNQFEAETMSFLTGDKTADSKADGKYVRTAIKGKSNPGHIVFGPYLSIDPGKYLAIFRIKKLGEGNGEVVSIDTAADANPTVPKPISVDSAALPIGEFVNIPVMFEHPGGRLETRVLWKGDISVSVDSISLWSVK